MGCRWYRFAAEPPCKEQIALNTKARTNAKSKSNATNNRIITGSQIVADSAVETFGEAVPGLMLESVVDSNHPDHLLLHTWNGRRPKTARMIEHGNVSYIPKTLARGLVQSVRFPPPSLPFESTTKVISSLRDLRSTRSVTWQD
jgi:hypothetical protein